MERKERRQGRRNVGKRKRKKGMEGRERGGRKE